MDGGSYISIVVDSRVNVIGGVKLGLKLRGKLFGQQIAMKDWTFSIQICPFLVKKSIFINAETFISN